MTQAHRHASAAAVMQEAGEAWDDPIVGDEFLDEDVGRQVGLAKAAPACEQDGAFAGTDYGFGYVLRKGLWIACYLTGETDHDGSWVCVEESLEFGGGLPIGLRLREPEAGYVDRLRPVCRSGQNGGAVGEQEVRIAIGTDGLDSRLSAEAESPDAPLVDLLEWGGGYEGAAAPTAAIAQAVGRSFFHGIRKCSGWHTEGWHDGSCKARHIQLFGERWSCVEPWDADGRVEPLAGFPCLAQVFAGVGCDA